MEIDLSKCNLQSSSITTLPDLKRVKIPIENLENNKIIRIDK